MGIKYTYLILPLLLMASACTAPIDIDTNDSEPVIVINGALTDEVKRQEIRIGRTAPYFQDSPNVPVSLAEVTIRSSDGHWYELFENDSLPGLYQTIQPWAVVVGETYQLQVTVDFDGDGIAETYQAETTVLPPIELDSSAIVPIDIMGYLHYALNFYAQDPPGKNYYLVKCLLNDTLMTYKISRYIIFDDTGIDGQYIDGLTVRYFESVDNWEVSTIMERDSLEYLSPGDEVGIEMSQIPRSYYDFIFQCQKELYGENPIFGGPASNIITNISGGGVGFFVAYCIVRHASIVPDAADAYSKMYSSEGVER